jgi:hypothetical protein
MPLQSEFNFNANSGGEGFAQWIAMRQRTAAEIADKLGLPLEHRVEVWLRGGIRLTGKLRLAEELLLVEEHKIRQLPLAIGKVTFRYSEMDSCVRVD